MPKASVVTANKQSSNPTRKTVPQPAPQQAGREANPVQSIMPEALPAAPANLLLLQRAAGNRAVSQLIQAKLQVGPANDRYEAEAERVARAVTAAPTPARAQREDDETPAAAVQASFQTAPASPGAGFEAGPEVESRLNQLKGRGHALPPETRSKMETSLGADFSGVRVHTGPDAADLNRQLQANAFTHGQDIYMGAGQYSPGSTAGQRLLAHELTHVVQQTGSRVRRSPRGLIQRRGRAQSPAEIKLSNRLASAVENKYATSPYDKGGTDANRLAVQQWIFSTDGGQQKKRTRDLERVLDNLRGHRKKKSQKSQPGERRIITAKHFMLMFAIAQPGNLDLAQQYQKKLQKNLDVDLYDDLSSDVRAALAAIGYTREHEMDVNINDFPEMTTLNTRLRYLQDIMAALEKDYQKTHPDTTFPNFRQMVPDRAPTGLGQVDSAIQRMSVRINFLQNLLGLPPDTFPTVDQNTGLIDKFKVLDLQSRRIQETLIPSVTDEKGKKKVFFKDTPHTEGGYHEKEFETKRVHFALEEAQKKKISPGSKERLTGQRRGVSKDELDALHRAALDQTREHMRQMLRTYVPTFMVQDYSSRMVDLILKQVHLEALQEMQESGQGLPPTNYAFMALGSGGRLESTSYSDLDFALVIENNQHKAYFQKLGRIMATKLNGLHERGSHGQSGVEPKGLRICEGGVFPANVGATSYGGDVLIGTPKELAKIQENTNFITVGSMNIPMEETAEVFDALREPRFAFGSTGGEKLFGEYAQALKETLNRPKPGSDKTFAQYAADKTLNIAVGFALPDTSKPSFDLKNEFYRLPQMLVKGLSLKHGVDATNTVARINALKGVDSNFAALADDLIDAVNTISRVRLKAHLHAGEQKDVIWWSDAQRPSDKQNEYALTNDEAREMRRIALNVLPRTMRYGRQLLNMSVDDIVVQDVSDQQVTTTTTTTTTQPSGGQQPSSPNSGRPLPVPPVKKGTGRPLPVPPVKKTTSGPPQRPPPPIPQKSNRAPQRPPPPVPGPRLRSGPKPVVPTPQQLDKEDMAVIQKGTVTGRIRDLEGTLKLGPPGRNGK